MKMTLRALALVLILFWVQADEHKEPPCESLNMTIDPRHLNTVLGSWVLVYGVSDGSTGHGMMKNLTSQEVTLTLLDNNTISYNEKNRVQAGDCSHFILNATVISGTDPDELKLKADGGIEETGGNKTPYEDLQLISFHRTCENCLNTFFQTTIFNNFFLIYQRKEQIREMEQKDKDLYLQRAACMGFSTEHAFTYDGKSELCE